MPITLYESHLSRDMDAGNVTVNYVVTGTMDPMEVRQAVLLDTSPTLFDRVRREPQLEHRGGDFYTVEIQYTAGDASEAVQPEGPPGSENSGGPGSGSGGSGSPGGGEGGPGGESGGGGGEPGEDDPLPSVSFGTSGGTAHILLSKETKIKVRVGGGLDPTDTQGAIGLVAGGGVEGCDVVVPRGEFSIPRKRRKMTLRYLRSLMGATGKTNKSEWWGFKAGELLYLGADGSGNNKVGWQIVHKFHFSENQKPAVVIPPNVTVAEVRGHEYVWAIFKDKVDTAAGEVYPLPTQIFVERVYDETEFSQLQI